MQKNLEIEKLFQKLLELEAPKNSEVFDLCCSFFVLKGKQNIVDELLINNALLNDLTSKILKVMIENINEALVRISETIASKFADNKISLLN